MEHCMVCLSNAGTLSRITTQSSEWKECHIQRIIEKHLWWWYLPREDNLQWICRQCWQEISSFNNFYLTVEEAHKQFQLMVTNIGITKPDGKLQIVKQEMMGESNFSMEDCKSNNIETLQIDELIIDDIKSDVEFKIIDFVDEANDQCLYIEESKKYEIENLDRDTTHCPDNEFDNEEKLLIPIRKRTSTRRKEKTIVKVVHKRTKPVSKSKPEVNDQFSDIEKSKQCEIENPDVAPRCSSDNFFAYEHENRVPASDKEDVNTFSETENHVNINSAKKCKSKATKVSQCIKTDFKIKRTKQLADNVIAKKIEISRENDKFLAEATFDLPCCICNARLTNFQLLKSHYSNEHNIQGYVLCCNKKWYHRGLLLDHIRVHQNPNYFKCPHCEKILVSRKSFDNHLEYHKKLNGTRKPAFTCKKCNKSFFKRFGYYRHQLLHADEGLRELICPYCSKVLTHVSALRSHIRYTHKLERTHACHLCDKKFKRPVQLKEHVSTHTGEPLYKCPYCPKTFIAGGSLYNHRNQSHRKEFEEVKLKKLTAEQWKNCKIV